MKMILHQMPHPRIMKQQIILQIHSSVVRTIKTNSIVVSRQKINSQTVCRKIRMNQMQLRRNSTTLSRRSVRQTQTLLLTTTTHQTVVTTNHKVNFERLTANHHRSTHNIAVPLVSLAKSIVSHYTLIQSLIAQHIILLVHNINIGLVHSSIQNSEIIGDQLTTGSIDDDPRLRTRTQHCSFHLSSVVIFIDSHSNILSTSSDEQNNRTSSREFVRKSTLTTKSLYLLLIVSQKNETTLTDDQIHS